VHDGALRKEKTQEVRDLRDANGLSAVLPLGAVGYATRRITKDDFDRIVTVIDHWWGGPISTLAHPIFYYELGRFARVVVDDADELVGFLLGFVADEAERTGYVHLVGIHPEHRRKGVARTLYQEFERDCASGGCLRMKAITTPGNEPSIRFHAALGWKVEELDGYAGPGRRRVVFTKPLAREGA
jgi:ribosomal protein S18 acetylase RimI-like enzyme